MCDESLFPDASPRFVIVFARARQPKVALLLMLASAKWAFCRWWTRQRFLWQETCARVHDFLRRTMSEPMRLLPWLTFDWDNSVFVPSCFRPIRQFGRATSWDRAQRRPEEVGYKVAKVSVWNYMKGFNVEDDWACTSLKKLIAQLHAEFFVLLSLCIVLCLCLCLSIQNTSPYFLLCV